MFCVRSDNLDNMFPLKCDYYPAGTDKNGLYVNFYCPFTKVLDR